jgi:hypothetical protein
MSVQLSGGRVTVYEMSIDGPQMMATYDATSGALLSRQEIQAAVYCGDERYACAFEPDALTVTDVASGEIRYRGRGDQFFIDGDRLIVWWEYRWPEPAGTELYDLRTGRRLNAYPGWQLASNDPRFGFLMVQELSDGGLLVAVRDNASGRLTVIGRARDWSGTATCSLGMRYVGCVGVTGARIWRLP